MLRNLWIGLLGLIAAVGGQQQAGPTSQGPPRPFTISPQTAAKIQQQQHLQQIHQQQQHHLQQQQQQQQHHHHNPSPPHFHPQPQRSAPPSPLPQNKPPTPQSPPKYVSRNRLDEEAGYQQKPRYSPPPPPKPAPAGGRLPQQQQSGPISKEEEEDYYEDEGPDRLTELLQKSKFECSSKKDGYYADETLNCEVFHYCQDSKKHSWMCPENMNFHQVHLICMPPSQDNICTKSANYHFVNEYLYRPINEKEAASRNTSLKYADRYYPEGYTPGMAIDEIQEQQPYQPRAPHRFGQQQNVFFNPESVNIPLTQRRPPIRQPVAQQSQSTEYYDE